MATIDKRVVLSQIEVQPDGIVQIRLDKQVVEGETVLSREYHRTAISPGASVENQMAAVNANLKEMGWPAVKPDVIKRIKRIVDVEHTPDVVKAHVAQLRAQGVRFGDEADATPAEQGVPNNPDGTPGKPPPRTPRKG